MVAIRVWNQCNNNCVMCSNYSVRNMQEGRNIDYFVNTIKEREPSPKEITLTGGEPFLNPKIFNLLKKLEASYPETPINILSNGRVFYYDKYCEELKKHLNKNIKIAISLLGPNPKIHDSITKARGSFNQTVKGVQNLIKRKIPVELRVIILKQNFEKLEDITQFIIKNLRGVEYVVFIFVDLISNAQKNKEQVAVSYSEALPRLSNSMSLLKEKGIDFRIYHFPLCIVPYEFWENSWISVEKSKIIKPKSCSKCQYSKYCVGILKGYYNNFGAKEFKIPLGIKITESNNQNKPILKVEYG